MPANGSIRRVTGSTRLPATSAADLDPTDTPAADQFAIICIRRRPADEKFEPAGFALRLGFKDARLAI